MVADICSSLIECHLLAVLQQKDKSTGLKFGSENESNSVEDQSKTACIAPLALHCLLGDLIPCS